MLLQEIIFDPGAYTLHSLWYNGTLVLSTAPTEITFGNELYPAGYTVSLLPEAHTNTILLFSITSFKG